MTSSTEAITQALQRLDKAKESYLVGEAKSTEAVLDAAQAILVAGGRGQGKSSAVSSTDNEKPSDFLQRVMWAEVRNAVCQDLSSGVRGWLDRSSSRVEGHTSLLYF
jgi:uncharacterized protein YgbK (DUF1537 family)